MPNLEDGSWYYGVETVLDYIRTHKVAHGILFVSKLATVRWHSEGAGTARELTHIMRPHMSPREATPVQFRGLYDEGCPDICDM